MLFLMAFDLMMEQGRCKKSLALLDKSNSLSGGVSTECVNALLAVPSFHTPTKLNAAPSHNTLCTLLAAIVK